IIVTAEGRTADARFRMDATRGDVLGGNPLVVLVNGGSASAAEIVAGALQDHHRATLVGHTTYGKGTVQTVIPISEGRALKITTSRYFTPSGASIQEKGITPDVVIAGNDEAGELMPVVATSSLTQRDREVSLALSTVKAARRAPTAVATAP
ncbi:MAG TPA: S41 family peptidase, partial [Steroidobacteraceae bacterium]